MNSLEVLFIGLASSMLLVALSDFKWRKVNDLLWFPAGLAGVYFYITAPLTVQVYVLPFVGGTIVFSSVIFLVFRSKGYGAADSIGIVAASLFPFLLVGAVVPAMIVSYVGIKLRLWGGAGVPVAGLIGVFSVAVLSLYILL